MPFDASTPDLDHDFEILEILGDHVDGLIQGVVLGGAALKTLRRWLVGHCEPPEEDEVQIVLMAVASDIELFTPSASGRTAVDRYVNSRRPESDDDREALAALAAAQFRLVRIIDRQSDDLVRLKDLVSGEELALLDSRIAPLAAGAPTAMRLCPLASGRQALISPLFVLDEPTLAAAMAFARGGKLPGGGNRCAAGLYRDIARRGFLPMPILAPPFDALDDLAEVEALALRWIAAETDEDLAELVADTRRAAALDTLVDACGLFAKAVNEGLEDIGKVFARIAEIQVDTLSQRARAGVSGYGDILDRAARDIAGYVAAGRMCPGAQQLLQRLAARHAFDDGAGSNEAAAPERADLDRVIQRIQALRAKTVDQGCTEAEAMAAAAKVAELLARHDLSLDEVGVRRSACAGVAVETTRRRRGPIDSCLPPVAGFCDCRVWSEESADGTLRYIFFGLTADVEAARFLHDLIEQAFETETAAFRRTDIYLALRGGDRRMAQNSFQVGLARGVADKLNALKVSRSTTAAATTGFDLVAIKDSVVEEEMDRLGLRFTTKSASARRFVHGEAYDAGKAAGALFEPNTSLGR